MIFKLFTLRMWLIYSGILLPDQFLDRALPQIPFGMFGLNSHKLLHMVIYTLIKPYFFLAIFSGDVLKNFLFFTFFNREQIDRLRLANWQPAFELSHVSVRFVSFFVQSNWWRCERVKAEMRFGLAIELNLVTKPLKKPVRALLLPCFVKHLLVVTFIFETFLVEIHLRLLFLVRLLKTFELSAAYFCILLSHLLRYNILILFVFSVMPQQILHQLENAMLWLLCTDLKT